MRLLSFRIACATAFLFQASLAMTGTTAVAQSPPGSQASPVHPFSDVIATGFEGLNAARIRPLLPDLAAQGVTGISTRVRWRDLEPAQGEYDWAATDALVDLLVTRRMTWVPVLDIGSPEAQPDWLRVELGVSAGETASATAPPPAISLWHPGLPAPVDRFLKAFGEHYRLVPELETVILQVTPEDSPRLRGAWEQEILERDPHARDSLQKWLRRRYERLMVVNDHWGTQYGLWTEVAPGKTGPESPEQRRRDENAWIAESLLDWTDFCLSRASDSLPQARVAVSVTDYHPAADTAVLSALVEMAEKNDGAVVIGSSADGYGRLFAETDPAITSARRAGAEWFLSLPPDLEQVSSRDWFYLAASEGAHRLLVPRNVLASGTWDVWTSLGPGIASRAPVRQVAVFFPDADLRLNDSDYFARAAALRDITDFDTLDEHQIAAGALADYRALVFLSAERVERTALRHVYAWIKDGGVLFYPRNEGRFRDDADTESYYEVLFNPTSLRDRTASEQAAGLPPLVSDAAVTHEQAARLVGEVSRRLGTGWSFLVPEREGEAAGPMYLDFVRLLLFGHVRIANFQPLDPPGDDDGDLYWTGFPNDVWMYYNPSKSDRRVLVYPRGTARRVEIPAGGIVTFNPASL